MKRPLHFTICTGCSTACIKINRAMNFFEFTLFILNKFITVHNVCPFKPNLLSRCHTEKFLHRRFHKIFPFNINSSAKRNLPCSHSFLFRIIFNRYIFHFIFRIVRKNNFNRINNSHNSRRLSLKVFTNTVF